MWTLTESTLMTAGTSSGMCSIGNPSKQGAKLLGMLGGESVGLPYKDYSGPHEPSTPVTVASESD